MTSSRNKRFAFTLTLAVGSLLTGGCVNESVSDETPVALVHALENGTIDAHAKSTCTEIYPTTQFLSTLDSSAGEIRLIAQPGPGGESPDIHDLPQESDRYIAICMIELPEGNPLDRQYMALWLTERSTVTGIVAAWNP